MNDEKHWVDWSEQNVKNAEDKTEDLDLEYLFNNATQLIISLMYQYYNSYDFSKYENMYKTLTDKDVKALRKKAKEVYETAVSKDLKSTAKTLKSSFRVKAINALLFETLAKIEEVYKKQDDMYSENLTNIYKDSYYKTAYELQMNTKIGYDVNKLDDSKVSTEINKKWYDSNYSDKIWNNRDKLATVLNQEIPRAIINGENPLQVAKVIKEKLNTSYKTAERLARTEYLHTLNEASYQSMQDTGFIKQYKYVATLDNRTSQMCRDMDGNIFKLSQKETGVNFPPLHPRCRSTTIPYFENLDGTRLAKDKDGKYYEIDSKISYREWEKMQNLEE